MVHPVEWADPKRPLCPVDAALRFARVGQCGGAAEQCRGRRRADCQRLFQSFKRRGAVMFYYRYDTSAKGQRRRLAAAIGKSGARMPEGWVAALFVVSPADEQTRITPG